MERVYKTATAYTDGASPIVDLNYTYEDGTNRLTNTTISTSWHAILANFEYGLASLGEMPDMVYTVKRGMFRDIAYEYDSLGRMTRRYLWYIRRDMNYTYVDADDGSNATSPQVASVTTPDGTTSYTYDAAGNITSETFGDKTIQYTYDTLNQLTGVTGGDKAYAYTYDANGNILTAQKGTITNTYTYGDNTWKDLLTAYNGQSITYDAIGNPLTYRDGINFTWENGRQLASYTQGNDSVIFDYYSDGGRRMKKKAGEEGTFYTYVDGVLYTQKQADDVLAFVYDEKGKPYMVIRMNMDAYISDHFSDLLESTAESDWYYYEYNLQGDVVGLFDASGTRVAAYTYDPWGKLLTVTDGNGNIVTDASHIANVNPLRYRGYYYDVETGLYYVSSRYYDPEIGRWINADNRISGVGGDVLGYNMFAYCMNNPVNMSDPSGGWPKWLETAVKVASVVVAVTAVVVMVATVSAVSAGTAAPGALLGASVFLGAALSGINGGVANEAKGNSYINGYLGGATGGAIQGACSKTPAGTIVGGGAGVTVGTAVTDVMNNLDPDSANSTAKEIASNAITSGGKALVTSSLTAYMGYASDLAAINGANGLMPTYTRGFGEAVKAFFGWLDDALVYIWE